MATTTVIGIYVCEQGHATRVARRSKGFLGRRLRKKIVCPHGLCQPKGIKAAFCYELDPNKRAYAKI